MRSGGLLKTTFAACATLAALVMAASALTGHLTFGVGIAAGLMLGSVNGYLFQALLGRGTPMVAGSLLRLVMFSSIVLVAALTLGTAVWTLPLGIGIAQLVMVGVAVRQGLRA
jgi:hypothetical protein